MDDNIQENGGVEENGAGGGQALDEAWGDAMNEQAEGEKAAGPAGGANEEGTGKAAAPSAEPAKFDALTQGEVQGGSNLDLILDIPVTISVELGRTRLLVKDLLTLGQGAVVELEKLAGEAMEILVNGKLIARGEAVVVNEKFGIKLTDIISPSERINKLK